MCLIQRLQCHKTDVLLFIIVFLLACNTTKPTAKDFIEELKGTGPQALNAEDPYYPANLVVNYQVENSSIISAFVEHNSAPPAIELLSGWFVDAEVIYYYPARREYYSITKIDGDWSLTGPKRIEPAKLAELEKLALPSKVALIYNQSGTIQTDSALTDNLRVPVATDNLSLNKSNSYKSKLSTIVDTLQNSGQSEIAEFNERGDLIHSIQFPYENLRLLAIWYTFDAVNMDRISRINKLSISSPLQIDQQLVIPAYLIQNRLKLTPAAFQLLSNEFPKNEL